MLKLETALAAMEGMGQSVRAAHKRAQEAVQGALLDIQIKECASFLSRATSHLEELDAKRATICQNIEMSKMRLAELKAQTVALPTQEDGAEVQQLRGLVSQLQAKIDTLRQNPSRDNQPEGLVLKRACRREDFVRQCNEEMEEWMAGRHADLQTAMALGQLPEVARVSQLMTNEWRQLTTPSLVANTVR